MFDHVLLLARGKCIYNGQGGAVASQHFATRGLPCPEGYNIADHLLDIASDPPSSPTEDKAQESTGSRPSEEKHEGSSHGTQTNGGNVHPAALPNTGGRPAVRVARGHSYATTFLTQLEVLSQREWKILRRLDLRLLS
jgi:hypothetical protein